MEEPEALIPHRRRFYDTEEWEEKKDVICEMVKGGKSHAAILSCLEEQFPDFRPT